MVNPEIPFRDIAIQTTVFSAISFITLIVFFKGQNKQPDSQTLYVLVAISLKFLLEMVFALIWLIVVKKSSLPSVLMFFVLYLTLTLFTVLVIIKTLKNKAL
jgi:F0F1-type ATP synthase assembly protein I